MEETIQWLKQFMNNRKLGNEVSKEYLEMVDALIECSIKLNVENQQYKQQIDELKQWLEEEINNSYSEYYPPQRKKVLTEVLSKLKEKDVE